MKLILGLVIMALLSSCLQNEEMNLSFRSFDPIEINDGHQLSSPSVEGVDSLGLVNIYKNAYQNDNLWSMRSMLVFRNGRLISESYFKDQEDITTQHLIWSCTKQFMGVLAGMAIDQGVIGSIDDPIEAYLVSEVDKHPDKAGISIRDLLTMQSGIDYENDGQQGHTHQVLQQNPSNLTNYILSQPMKNSPGQNFYYKDGDPQLLSAVIQNATGKPTDEWADEVLFSEIGLTNYNWVRYKDGVSLGGFGIETTPREMAKLALLVANDGNWNGQQLVPVQWITDMTSTQVDTDSNDYDFGYYWWIDNHEDIYFMWGHGGQFAFIVPTKNLVVVMTSIPNTQGDYQVQADEALSVIYDIMKISL